MRKTAVVLVSILATLAAFGLGTQPAAAAANPSIITVTRSKGAATCALSATSARANVGDVLTLHAADAPILVKVDAEPTFALPGKGSAGVSFATLGVHTITVCPAEVVTVNIVAEPVAAPAVHDDIQQVGVPASGDCADVDPAVGHYVGAPIGGWSKSWAWWINDGKGGPVCTRELAERSDGTIVLVG